MKNEESIDRIIQVNTAAYEEIMLEAGLNRFIMSVKQWVSRTNSKGIVTKAGWYGGIYAYKDIAFGFDCGNDFSNTF